MKKVDIYTSDSCQYCHKAMEFFNENNIDYTEHNITKDKDARMEIMNKGYRSVPLIIIGEKEILGFDREVILEALN